MLRFKRPLTATIYAFLVPALLALVPLRAEELTPIQAAWQAEDWAQVEKLAKAMTKGEEPAEGWWHLSMLENARGDSKQALKHAEKAVELAPDNAQMQIQLGSALNHRIEKASVFTKPGLARRLKTAFETALALEPTNVRSLNALIRFHQEAPGIVGGDKDLVPVYQERLWEASPIAAALQIVTPAMETGDFATARAALTRAQAAVPDSLGLTYQQAKLAALSGEDLAEGQRILEAYLQLPDPPEPGLPSHAGALMRLGQIYAQQGEVEKAREIFARSLSLEPTMRPLIEPELAKLDD